MAMFKGDEYVRFINGITEILIVKSFCVRVSDGYVLGVTFSKIADGVEAEVEDCKECEEVEVYIPTELINIENGVFKRYVESTALKIELGNGIYIEDINGDSSSRVINNGCLDRSKR